MKRQRHTRKPWRSLRAEALEERLPLSTMLALMHEGAPEGNSVGLMNAPMAALPMLAPGGGGNGGGGGGNGGGGGGGGGGGHTEAFGNNLSFPVIWSDGVTKALRGEEGGAPDLHDADRWAEYTLNGQTELVYLGENDPPPGAEGVVYFYQQQGESTWQADVAKPELEDEQLVDVHVDWIDWGDNLESVDWYTRSMVRVENVLFKDLPVEEPMTGFEMKHLEGLGINELWGVTTTAGGAASEIDSAQATIYSNAARLTIQRLNVEREDPALEGLIWNATIGEWVDPEGQDLVNEAIFNKTVWEGGDGPGYYSAEVNVKGRVIYGYTWNARDLNEGAADYRLTFSLDATNYPGELNTFFVEGTTEILVTPEEELEAMYVDTSSTEGGATPEIDFENNLTFIDVRILERGGGGGGGGKKGGGGKGGGRAPKALVEAYAPEAARLERAQMGPGPQHREQAVDCALLRIVTPVEAPQLQDRDRDRDQIRLRDNTCNDEVFECPQFLASIRASGASDGLIECLLMARCH